MPATPYAHTHRNSPVANISYQVSLFALIFLAGIVVLASGYDIVQQVIKEGRGRIRFTDTSITAGAYLFFIIVAVSISFSRLWTLRKTLASIPKGYLPIGRDDVSKNVYRLVASEYSRCAMILSACQPHGRKLAGWGDPSGPYANVNFRIAILETLRVLEKTVPVSRFSAGAEGFDESALPPSKSHRVSPLARYIPLAKGSDPILPKSLTPLLLLYEKHLEDARWRQREPEVEEYEDCLRIVAVLVDVLSKRLPAMQLSDALSSSDSIDYKDGLEGEI